MRRSFLAAAAALLLLSGCHEYWGSASSGDSLSSSGTATATYDPTADDQEAQRNVRAAIPAIEAWHAEHGTYRGMTVPALNSEYDRTIGDNIRLVGPLTKDMYCVESSVGTATWRKAGPGGLVEGGFCGDTSAAAPPPPRRSSGDPQTDLRSAVPAIEAWYADHGRYTGMTVDQLRAEYDYGVSSGIRIVNATKKSYCVEATVNGDTWSYWGPRTGFRHAGC
jgi:hypothetical protein